MRPGVSLGVLGYPGVSWGNQTDPDHSIRISLETIIHQHLNSINSETGLFTTPAFKNSAYSNKAVHCDKARLPWPDFSRKSRIPYPMLQ